MAYNRETLEQQLKALADPGYRDFMAPLIPDADPETILGVRLPQLRKLAGDMERRGEAEAFFEELPHRYLEEDHLHSFLIDLHCREFTQALRETERFLPQIRNWAVCDSFRPRALQGEKARLYPYLLAWLDSEAVYTRRLSLVLQLNWYLGEDFDPKMLESIARLRSNEYYVNMAAAWYWSMALVYQYDAAIPYLKEQRLSPWIHNKAIAKARESRQIPRERKACLKTLKV